MKFLSSRVFWGLLLIVGGILFLLQAFDLLAGEDIFWGLAFAAAGSMFLWGYFENRGNWGLLIPGFVLWGIAGEILVDLLPKNVAETLDGVFILSSIGLAFWAIYLVTRSNWWAIIPGGVMLTLAVVTVLDNNPNAIGDLDTGGVFLLGLGVTFALLAILPGRRREMTWALIPAVVLGVIGFFLLATSSRLIAFVGPAVLILLGLYVLYRGFRR
jgi:hypothetical protein